MTATRKNELQPLANAARKLRGNLSRNDVAKASGLHISTIKALELGTVTPQASTIRKIAGHYQVPRESLLQHLPRDRQKAINTLGSYLQELRGHQTLATAAEATGISPHTINALENGRRRLTRNTANKLAAHYRVPAEDIIQKAGYPLAHPRSTAPPPTPPVFHDTSWDQPDPTPPNDPLEEPERIARASTLAQAAAGILQNWLEGLEPRQQAMFHARYTQPRTTLQKMADSLAVSHQRAQQIAAKLSSQMEQLPERPGNTALQSYLDLLKQSIKAALPEEQAARTLGLELTRPVTGALLHMAGPFHNHNGWLVNARNAEYDPTPALLQKIPKGERIGLDEVSGPLETWGLPPERHRAWLLSKPEVIEADGRLVTEPRTHADRAVLKLNQLGRPATMREMTGNSGYHFRTQATAVQNDPRIVHVSHNLLALARWNLPQHGRGYADNIAALLNAQGPTRTDDLVAALVETRGYKIPTIRSIAKAPRFITEDGTVRLRTPEDPPLVPDQPTGPVTQRGTFKTGPRTATLNLPINPTELRGSSLNLGMQMTALLQIQGNSVTDLTAQDGQTAQIRYPANSANGAQLSSLRTILREQDAQEGDCLVLTIDALNQTLHCNVIKPSQLKRNWHTISQLTGTSESTGPEALAQALQCAPEQIRQVLQKRGDRTISDHLPE